MTDGRWNGYEAAYAAGGNKDGVTTLTLPDGTVYSNTGANAGQTNIYRDGTSNTLADWAFKSWSEPLQASGLTGAITPTAEYDQAPATETIGGVALKKYWNPKYNPANWPHMVTYTIGFSSMSYTWPGAPTILAPTEMVPFGYNGSFPNLVNGTQTWPVMDNENKRSLDLWHAAIDAEDFLQSNRETIWKKRSA
jgi:type IV pilus assembly protein PilY1